MGDTVIVYVTRTGNSRFLAESLGKITGAPVYEIKDLTKRKGFFGFMRGGAQASRKLATPILDPAVPLSGVKTVIMVQPVWASNLCPPLRTWINSHRSEISGSRLALIASNQGSPPERFRSNVENEFGKLAAFAGIVETLDAESKIEALKKFLASL